MVPIGAAQGCAQTRSAMGRRVPMVTNASLVTVWMVTAVRVLVAEHVRRAIARRPVRRTGSVVISPVAQILMTSVVRRLAMGTTPPRFLARPVAQGLAAQSQPTRVRRLPATRACAIHLVRQS